MRNSRLRSKPKQIWMRWIKARRVSQVWQSSKPRLAACRKFRQSMSKLSNSNSKTLPIWQHSCKICRHRSRPCRRSSILLTQVYKSYKNSFKNSPRALKSPLSLSQISLDWKSRRWTLLKAHFKLWNPRKFKLLRIGTVWSQVWTSFRRKSMLWA